jgi:hypothetical protein
MGAHSAKTRDMLTLQARGISFANAFASGDRVANSLRPEEPLSWSNECEVLGNLRQLVVD